MNIIRSPNISFPYLNDCVSPNSWVNPSHFGDQYLGLLKRLLKWKPQPPPACYTAREALFKGKLGHITVSLKPLHARASETGPRRTAHL